MVCREMNGRININGEILDESEVGSDAQDQQATEAVDESNKFDILLKLI